MKIRTGYVSNSSSMSFILKTGGDFQTVRDVALYIMEDFAQYDMCQQDREVILKLDDPDIPVFFDTSDGTYIRKMDDKIVVSTNHSLNTDKIKNQILPFNKVPKSLLKQVPYEREMEDGTMKMVTPTHYEMLDYYYKHFDDFFILRHGFRGRTTYCDSFYGNGCKKCNKGMTRGWVVKGKDYCNCETDKLIIQYQRLEKLKKINKNI